MPTCENRYCVADEILTKTWIIIIRAFLGKRTITNKMCCAFGSAELVPILD